MRLAGLLFDKDGTLVDFDQTWGRAGYAVMQHLGRGDDAAVERLAAAMHYAVEDRRFAPTSPLIAGAPDAYVHLWAEALGRPADQTLLDELNRAFADETLRSLATLGLDAHMDFIAGYDTGHGGKPEPGMVLAFARQIGVDPSRVAMVGDSPFDLMAAKAAGAVAVAVLSGPALRHELEPLADHVLDGIEDLPALVDRLAAYASGG